jgi:hypothetical protein
VTSWAQILIDAIRAGGGCALDTPEIRAISLIVTRVIAFSSLPRANCDGTALSMRLDSIAPGS